MAEKQLESCNGAGNGLDDAEDRRESLETIAPDDPERGAQLETKLVDIPPDGGYGVRTSPA